MADKNTFSQTEIKESSFIKRSFSKKMKIKGWSLSKDSYVGYTKVDGKYGLGVIVQKDKYVFGMNHRRISVVYKF